MRYLIDTNIFLFVIQEQDKLSKDVQFIIDDYENKIYISSESIKEIILLLRAKKIEVPKWKTTKDFSALPDGRGKSSGKFDGAGYFGNWWSSEENGVDIAYSRYMDYRNEEVNYHNYYYKRYLYNIRCIQD